MLIPLTEPFLVTIAGLWASAGAAENAPASASAKATMIERTASRESLPSLQCANIDISSHPEWRSVTLYDARSSALDAAQLDFCGNTNDQRGAPPMDASPIIGSLLVKVGCCASQWDVGAERSYICQTILWSGSGR